MSTLEQVIKYSPMVVAPIVLMLFSMVSAYVFKFGKSRTGINQDYLLFAFYVIVACYIGGAI